MDTEALKPILAGIVRHALTSAGGALVAGGYIQSSDTSALVGGGMVIAGMLWSWWQKEGQAKVSALLQKMTATKTPADAVKAAGVLPPAAAVDTAAKSVSVQSVVKVLLIAFLLSAFLVPAAFAQGLPKLKPLTGNIVNDIGAAINPRAAPTSNDPLQNIIGALDAKLLPDLLYAKTMADASGSKVTGPCYGAWIDLINVRQKAVTGTDGQPLAFPDPGVISRFEQIVELRNALQPDSSFMIACSPVASMVKKDIVGFIGIVISGGAGLATLVPGL